MTTWSFRDALEELKARGGFNESVLRSALGLRLGDIRFAEIQTTNKMCAVCLNTFLQFVKQGCLQFQTICLWMATVKPWLYFLPSSPTCALTDIECTCRISNVIQRCGSPLGDISSIQYGDWIYPLHLKHWVQEESAKAQGIHDAHRELWRAHGFCHIPSILCCTYAADCKNTDDPSKMTPQWTLKLHAYDHGNQQHGGEEVVVFAQLGAQQKGNWLQVAAFSFQRGMQFGPGLFPEIVIPHNHTGPLVDWAMWQEVPFRLVGPFWAKDLIFSSLPGDLELFMAKEVAKLKELGFFNLSQHTWAPAALSATCILQSV